MQYKIDAKIEIIKHNRKIKMFISPTEKWKNDTTFQFASVFTLCTSEQSISGWNTFSHTPDKLALTYNDNKEADDADRYSSKVFWLCQPHFQTTRCR